MASNASVKPPLNDPPIAKDGQFAQSWAAHLDDMTRSVNQIGVGAIKGIAVKAGNIGEVLVSTPAASVPLSSGVSVTVASLALTAGDWDVTASVAFHPTGTTSFRSAGGGLSLTNNAFPGLTGGAGALIAYSAQVPAIDFGFPVGVLQVNSAAAGTVYLTAVAAFTVSTCTAYGSLRARRLS